MCTIDNFGAIGLCTVMKWHKIRSGTRYKVAQEVQIIISFKTSRSFSHLDCKWREKWLKKYFKFIMWRERNYKIYFNLVKSYQVFTAAWQSPQSYSGIFKASQIFMDYVWSKLHEDMRLLQLNLFQAFTTSSHGAQAYDWSNICSRIGQNAITIKQRQ